jgi:acylphosphatase
MRKLIAHVSGKVQMAGYRSKVVTIAKAFDLKGYVRNLPDGRVKILAEGSDADLERFLKAIKIENTLIKVEDVEAEFSEGLGAYDDFFKVVGERETDARLDAAAVHLKELIAVVREGFKDNGSKLDVLIDKVDETREDIVSEVKGLRSDLKGRMEERLQRIESDVVEIKARMRS